MNSTVNVLVNRALVGLLPDGTVAYEAKEGLAELLNSTHQTFDLPSLLGLATQLVTQHQSGAFEESSALDDWKMFFTEDEQEENGFEEIAKMVKSQISGNLGINLVISLALSLLPASTVKNLLKAIFASISTNNGQISQVAEITTDYLKPALVKHLAPEAATQLMSLASELTGKK